MDLDGLRAVLDAIRDGCHPHRGHRYAGAFALLARDPQRQPVRLPGRRPARRAPRPRRPDAPHAAAPITPKAPARWTPPPSRRWPPKPGRPCATPRNCTKRCAVSSLLPRGDGPPEPISPRWWPPGRAATLTVGGRDFWVAAERLDLVRRVYPQAAIDPPIAAPPRTRRPFPNRPKPAPPKFCAAGSNAPARCARPDLARDARHAARAGGPGAGATGSRRARFCAASSPGRRELEWCHRRLLARIHRLTIGRLRREIEPVTTAEFFAFLHRWQHLAPGTPIARRGRHAEIVRQMQGCEFAAAAWEAEMLPRRVARYKPEYLDLALPFRRSDLGPALAPPGLRARAEDERQGRRVRPTRVAPLAIFLREDSAWLLAAPAALRPTDSLSHPAREVLAAHRNPRRVFLRRPHARHRPAGQRSGGRALGVGGRRPGDRRWLREPARAARPQAPPRRGRGRTAARATRPADGACCAGAARSRPVHRQDHPEADLIGGINGGRAMTDGLSGLFADDERFLVLLLGLCPAAAVPPGSSMCCGCPWESSWSLFSPASASPS